MLLHFSIFLSWTNRNTVTLFVQTTKLFNTIICCVVKPIFKFKIEINSYFVIINSLFVKITTRRKTLLRNKAFNNWLLLINVFFPFYILKIFLYKHTPCVICNNFKKIVNLIYITKCLEVYFFKAENSINYWKQVVETIF